MLQIRHAELLAEVASALHAVSPDPTEPCEIEADHDLVQDLSMDGRQVQQALELLEERLGVVFPSSFAFDLAIEGPTVGRLVRRLALMMEGKRHAI